MSERRQRLTLQTTNTHWITPGYPETINPYQRVIGVGFGLRYTLRAAMEYFPHEEDHGECISWLTPNSFGGRLYDFYQTFLSRRLIASEPSSCFDFATYMDDVELPRNRFGRALLPDWSTTYDYVCGILSEGEEVTTPPPLGTHVVIGAKDKSDDEFAVLHSAVSMGDDTDKCIQMMSDNPYQRIMGIDTYQNVLDYYQSIPGNTDTELTFFAIPAQG